MKTFTLVSLTLGLLLAAASHAATIVNEGVLGNSGEQGAALVRFAAEPVAGLGIVYDRFGTLWDRAGKGTLNRYTLDGRLLGQYRVPNEFSHFDQLTPIGDTLVILIRGRIFTLPIDAPPGSAAQPLARISDLTGMSFGTFEGQVAVLNKAGVSLLNPTTGELKPVATVADAREVELGPDGAIYTQHNDGVHKFVNGAEVTDGWPAQRPGMRMQLIAGIWYGHSYHTTIRRHSASLEPQPGVVLGGSSGSVIGRLDSNPELHNGFGLARIRENIFAVSGNTGIVHLLEWKDGPQQFEIVRRIGSVPYCTGLGLNDDGNIWCNGGTWLWADRPDTPLRFGVPAPEFPGTSQVAMHKDGRMLATAMKHGKFHLFAGKLNSEVTVSEVTGTVLIPAKDVTGAVALSERSRTTLLTINAAGQAQAFNIAGNNRVEGAPVAVTLQFSTPVKVCTSLTLRDARTLLVAADGAVIELQPEDTSETKDWRETRRWNSWGTDPTEKFGTMIHIAADAGRLWVADRERHRIVCLDLASQKTIATFGTPDQTGDTNPAVNQPTTIAVRGDRAVFYDSKNQRLIKLRLL